MMKKTICISIFLINILFNIKVIAIEENIEKSVVEEKTDEVKTETTTEKQIIENGTYVIRSAINSKFVLDVNGASKNNGANVQLYEYSADPQKRFKVTHLENGYYSIIAEHSNKSLDVKDASKAKGANVWQWEQNGTDAQKWLIMDAGNGYYSIISKCNGLYVDVHNANANNFTNIQMCDGNGLNAQKFKFEKIKTNSSDSTKPESTPTPTPNPKPEPEQKPDTGNGEETPIKRTIEDGTYVIRSSINTKFVLDVNGASKENNANIQLYEYSADPQKRFKVTYLEDGYYSIIAEHSNKSLDVKDASKQKGANVRQWEYTEKDSQKWLIKDAGNGYYSIISKCNGLYVDVHNAKASNFTNIQMCDGNGLNAQKFKFEKLKTNSSDSTKPETKPDTTPTPTPEQKPEPDTEKEETPLKRTIQDGTYVIRSAINQKYVLDVNGASKNNGANVHLYEYSVDPQKRFKVKYLEDGYYSIIAEHSNKALDVKDASKAKGANVWQWEQNGTDAQKWIIKDAGNGTYNIISKCNGLYVDVHNANANNFTNIQMCDGNGLNAQKFVFKKAEDLLCTTGTYGKSGLKVKGDSRGTDLKYYKIGQGQNVMFATFSIHGFEDSFDHDGKELTYIAEQFKNHLVKNLDYQLYHNWTIYIFPTLNPDGQTYGTTNNGEGRTTLYSAAPNNKGIDMNRNFQATGQNYKKYTDDRNYNGTEAFQAYEARYLREFLLSKKSAKGQTILIDLHGWLDETMGDNGLGEFYRKQFGMEKHISTYGQGYLINWARMSLGNSNKVARTALIELPQVNSHEELVKEKHADKYINATINMLKSMI